MIEWLAEDSFAFPGTGRALGPDTEAPGLLAAGGDLQPQRLREAYTHGIFPWYGEGQPPLWWSPDPRMVLQTRDFKPSHSLRKTLRRFALAAEHEIRVDSDRAAVMRACASAPREGQNGTWILPEMQAAYLRWAELESAVHSVETWVAGELVGGLYGVNIGRMFFGESMFMRRTDGSKIALAALVCLCRKHGITWIDCQQNTRHLASLGAHEVPRQIFEAHLAQACHLAAPTDWRFEPADWAWLEVLR
ncbi:MAG: leucyl/phenylalanyl-tRNA--protein transferase [Paucibacter sp.]|nr:leucyl/phenylalanyl-tRNA--protein transferase [Roseateles sp.]